ncbi:MAG: UDP-glucose/GDP-mannose dehydrogenase family protein [bacterium]|nr:UDP-glucose/GDP-mannose dehydrogenase family protein [bacterium]
MKIVFIGTGYVGLVSGTCFSEFGLDVTCVDLQDSKIESLNQGKMPIYEPGLEELVQRNRKEGRLSFTTNLSDAVGQADVIFIAVGTPTRESDGHADLKYVDAAVEQIGKALQGYSVVVTKSTVPVGTGRRVEQIIRKANPSADFDVASNPEFLREGSAIKDFMKPDRVVVGTTQDRAQKVMEELYSPLSRFGVPVLQVDLETAELTKYAANAFLATKLAFINEIADLCEACGANVESVGKGMGLDSRIGSKFLQPGPGYGGSCFPKDTLALVCTGETYKTHMSVVENVAQSNDKRKQSMAQKITNAAGGDIRGKTVAILGVTFKANTDDMRESPSLDIIPGLQKAGAKIQAFDPEGMEEAGSLFKDVVWAQDTYSALEGADFCVIVTEWNAFKGLDLQRVKKTLREPILIDLRNLYEPEDLARQGFRYISIGRSVVSPQLA